MLFVNTLLIVTSFICLLLGLLVILSNPKKRENQTLSLFVLSVFLWMLTNLLTNLSSSEEVALIFGSSTFAVAALVPLAFLVFTRSYLGMATSTRLFMILFVLPVVLFAVSPTRLNIQSIGSNGLDIVTGPAYYLLIIEALLYVGYASVLMSRSYRKPSTPRIIKAQIRYMFIGFIAAFIPILILNGIAPMFSESDTVILLGPNAVVILVIFMSLNIIRHKFLDIRVLVVRSLGYILSIFTAGLLYGVFAFVFIGNIILKDTNTTLSQQLLYATSAVVLAFTFQPLKRFFDKATNKLFYQDAYEAQGLLDELNQVLVSTAELEPMLKRSAVVIASNIKPEYCVFGLEETEYEAQRIIGETNRKFNKDDIDFAKKITPQMDHKVIVADYLEEGNKDLQRRMRKNDVAVLVRITSGVDQRGVGYIVLGAKKSGNPYNSQDMRVLETIANSMVIAIDNALRFEEIQKFNITLEKKVEDATRRLQRANDKLVALDQTKDDFISMASHQLRTPLTSVKGYLSMVLEGDAGKVNAQQQKLLDQAFISSQRMVYLIADLLNVSRLRTGKFVIEPSAVNLAEVVEGEVSQLVETAAARNLKLTYKRPDTFPDLMLDETKIRQVVMNFIDNAIYYTPSGGKIEVHLRDTGRFIEYTVQDTGIGVPKSEQHSLFSKFFRAGNARKARPDGTGLGLFMAKKVVVAQGGAVIFKSVEGKGSTFGFTFEKAKLAPKE